MICPELQSRLGGKLLGIRVDVFCKRDCGFGRGLTLEMHSGGVARCQYDMWNLCFHPSTPSTFQASCADSSIPERLSASGGRKLPDKRSKHRGKRVKRTGFERRDVKYTMQRIMLSGWWRFFHSGRTAEPASVMRWYDHYYSSVVHLAWRQSLMWCCFFTCRVSSLPFQLCKNVSN